MDARDPTGTGAADEAQDVEAWLAQGERHLRGGDVVRAVSCFGSALLADRSNVSALRGLGRCAELAGHRDTAALCFARAEQVRARATG